MDTGDDSSVSHVVQSSLLDRVQRSGSMDIESCLSLKNGICKALDRSSVTVHTVEMVVQLF